MNKICNSHFFRKAASLCFHVGISLIFYANNTQAAKLAKSNPIDDAKAAIRDILRDPNSAQFKDIHVAGTNICGWFNAKNSYGGYGDWERFLYDTKSKYLLNRRPIEIDAELALLEERQKKTSASLFEAKLEKVKEKATVQYSIDNCLPMEAE